MNNVNITAWATVTTAGLAVMLAFGAYIRRSIKNSIDNLASVLDERLATKDAVHSLETKVAVLEEKVNHG